MSNYPSKTEFANVVGAAFAEQFCDGGHRVMNNPIIVYDYSDNSFGSQSSLTPLGDDEIIVLELEDGMFGEYDQADYNGTAWAVAGYFTEDCDNGRTWEDVLDLIDN